MTTGITDKAIEKLTNLGCKIHDIQLPFIVLSIHDTFYKCKLEDVLKHDNIHNILKNAIIPRTINDIK